MLGATAACAVEVQTYFYAMRKVALILAEMFKTFFPDEYERYRQAFDAGVWLEQDPGPWGGRAIVYKLDLALHWDKGDGGPTATFPVGFFDGGIMEIPQLRARLRYSPGDVVISLSGLLAHHITHWTAIAPPLTSTNGCNPGRIGNVFFFKKIPLERLEHHEPLWGKKTAYGQYERLTSTT
ncbi:hypothetical protein C8Q80DRAFT_1108850 [Daedaleopsis nitida]|nr:hypothetical protein C8Q80DRAFT_1108850 [Daedaleopsis nitida]